MPLFNRLIGLDTLFHESKVSPIILNDLSSRTEADREYFNSLVRENFTSGTVSMMPTCSCGELKGNHLIGEICDTCNTSVRNTIEKEINPTIWFRRPNGVEKLLNPVVWIMLDDRFTKSHFRIMQWLTDRNYNPNIKKPDIIDRMIAAGIPRGYNAFVQNFDAIMDYLFSLADFKAKAAKVGFLKDMIGLTHPSGDPLQQLIAENREAIFSDYIPIINRCLLVIEQNPSDIYVEKSVVDIKNALNAMLSIDQDYYNKTPSAIENRTAKIMAMLIEYYYNSLLRVNMSPKAGHLRKHNYGSRTIFSFRALITSHEEIHDYDEIWIPWGVGMTAFQLHILNRLMREDSPVGYMTHNEALTFIYQHIHKYHPALDKIFRDLISETRDGRGIPIVNQRN